MFLFLLLLSSNCTLAIYFSVLFCFRSCWSTLPRPDVVLKMFQWTGFLADTGYFLVGKSYIKRKVPAPSRVGQLAYEKTWQLMNFFATKALIRRFLRFRVVGSNPRPPDPMSSWDWRDFLRKLILFLHFVLLQGITQLLTKARSWEVAGSWDRTRAL